MFTGPNLLVFINKHQQINTNKLGPVIMIIIMFTGPVNITYLSRHQLYAGIGIE